MSFDERKVAYFKEAGNRNTDTILKLVEEYTKRENINDIVVASTTGETGAKASEIFKGRNVVVVTHSYGFQEPGKNELQEAFKEEILRNDARIFS
jgi:hypothetical protein